MPDPVLFTVKRTVICVTPHFSAGSVRCSRPTRKPNDYHSDKKLTAIIIIIRVVSVSVAEEVMSEEKKILCSERNQKDANQAQGGGRPSGNDGGLMLKLLIMLIASLAG